MFGYVKKSKVLQRIQMEIDVYDSLRNKSISRILKHSANLDDVLKDSISYGLRNGFRISPNLLIQLESHYEIVAEIDMYNIWCEKKATAESLYYKIESMS